MARPTANFITRLRQKAAKQLSNRELATTWHDYAACVDKPSEWFFPLAEGSERAYDQALKTCAGCPVLDQCREFALKTYEPFGMWGGTTPKQRLAMLRGKPVT